MSCSAPGPQPRSSANRGSIPATTAPVTPPATTSGVAWEVTTWNGFPDAAALTGVVAVGAGAASSLAIDDLNGDRLPDLVVGSNGSATNLYLNLGPSGTGAWLGL